MTNEVKKTMEPFEIWTASLPVRRDKRMKCGCRPVVIVSEESYEELPYVSIVPLTSELTAQQLPSHVLLCSRYLDAPSRALCEQVTTLEKSALHRRIGYVEEAFDRFALRRALAVHLNLTGVAGTAFSDDSIYGMVNEA